MNTAKSLRLKLPNGRPARRKAYTSTGVERKKKIEANTCPCGKDVESNPTRCDGCTLRFPTPRFYLANKPRHAQISPPVSVPFVTSLLSISAICARRRRYKLPSKQRRLFQFSARISVVSWGIYLSLTVTPFLELLLSLSGSSPDCPTSPPWALPPLSLPPLLALSPTKETALAASSSRGDKQMPVGISVTF